jgi:hypothetical protein
MAQGGRKGGTFSILVSLPIFLFFFLLSPFFIHLFLGGRKGSTFNILVSLPIFLFFFFALSFFHPSFLFCPDTGKDVRREQQMGHEDIGVRNGDRQL